MNDHISDRLRAACARLAATAPRLTPEQVTGLAALFRHQTPAAPASRDALRDDRRAA